MKKTYSASELKKLIEERIKWDYGKTIDRAVLRQAFKSTCRVVRDIIADSYAVKEKQETTGKEIYYMSMEFLPGSSLRNHAFNLGFEKSLREALLQLGFDLDDFYELEPDAGLGNGGLGRLASCYLDSMSTLGIKGHGMSICYEYGVFRQVTHNNVQKEEPDLWMDLADCWLSENHDESEVVMVGDKTILAIPHDMYVTGYDNWGINNLRLWEATSPKIIDMELFSRGKYLESMEDRHHIEVISKILYPEDAHLEGKILRLSQQYFFVSASMKSMARKHYAKYGTLSNLHEKVIVHVNDTHPSLVVPELMRILMDEYDLDWDYSFDMIKKMVTYTNHTIMPEALEKWEITMFNSLLPRIGEIIAGIDERFRRRISKYYRDQIIDEGIYIINNGYIHMANMMVLCSGKVNGVSSLHADIVKNQLFKSFSQIFPAKFTGVTNGISYRRWLCQANAPLTRMISELIGTGFLKDAELLSDLLPYQDNESVLTMLSEIKRGNKLRLIEYIKNNNDITVNPDSIFTVQAKRLHEYKRQLLNVFHIIDLYLTLKDNPNAPIHPRTFIFSAKAASGYYIAKQIISLILNLGSLINNDKDVKDILKVVFLENYSVSLSEILIPAVEISEQISLAGKEASGTGNMKMMINGAVTLGTLDGANVEIKEKVGDDNIFIFGMKAEEAEALSKSGSYNPLTAFLEDKDLSRILEFISTGINGVFFNDLLTSMTTGFNGPADQYFITKDFQSYKATEKMAEETYKDILKWNKMSLINIGNAGFFSADRSVKEYYKNIWNGPNL
ncbi:MAG: glycogen/starch/alpha-glucan phosphorylase [Anaerovoracaceae bacterium]